MRAIGANHQGLVEEQFLALPECDPMGLPILLEIPIVPVEADAFQKRIITHG